ncbi:cytochrome P450, partial [Asaia platycodi]|uniref:cytochrome P450 n=1 Tax=Asaia platycodi TaxID=610243 RepID=UPI0011DDC878
QFQMMRATMRNPVEALPEAAFHDRLVERRLARQHIVYVCAPDLVREALVTNSDRLDKGEGLRRAIGPGLGDGLLTAEGAHWRWQRQALAPVFRASGIGTFFTRHDQSDTPLRKGPHDRGRHRGY